MSSYTWPAELPQYANIEGYSEKKVSNVIRTPMEAGVSKMRTRGRKPQVITAAYDMDNSQILELESFLVTINNIYRFDLPHPRTGNIVEVRIVPQGDGEMYSISPLINGAMWRVNFILEIMP